MNFVPCLAWVAKGIAKSRPDKLQLSADELKKLIEDSKKSIHDNEAEEEKSDLSGSDEDSDSPDHIQNNSTNGQEDNEDLPTSDNDDDDFNSKYNLDNYDDNDDERPFMNIADVATFVDNKEDNYITDYDEVNKDEAEDDEDFIIKDSDNLLVSGHVEEESSVLEIHVYNKEEDAFYIHHDIVLPAYPLALEWLDFHPADDSPGNYIAVGDMTPVIKIWDLDVVEVLEPDYCLGEKLKSKKKGEKIKLKCHKDAVISLSWNKNVRNILASGSADSSIIIWNLQEATALHKLKIHSNKVQSLQWHPFESSFLLSSCTDGVIKVHDCRNPDAECKSWTVEGEIERVCWNLHDSLKFFCSTDTGFVHSFNMKSSDVEHSIKAHSAGVTALDMCHQYPNILMTASMDKSMKLWNIENEFKLVNSQKLKVGSIYTAKFAPDTELPVAVGGNYPSNSLKVVDLLDVVAPKQEDEKIASDIKLGKKIVANNPKVKDTRPPKKKLKKMVPKNSKKSTADRTFNRGGPSQKTSQDQNSSVKRIHKKYT